MPDMTTQLDGLAAWLETNWLTALIVVVGAFVVFRVARPLIHRAVMRMVKVNVPEGADPALVSSEIAKRAGTIEDILSRALRIAVVGVVVLIVMTMLGLLPVIAGLGIVLAALTIAGQPIILDYLMGILILAEGQYYQGDWIAVGTVEGTVEEVGLRRTVVRDATGTVHSISNGEIRIASNLTRLYASLQVDVPVVPGTDLDRAAAIVNRVGAEMAEDPEWRDRLLEPPHFARVVAVTDTGIMLRATGRIRATDRWEGPGELRRRLLAAFAAEGVELAQRGRMVMVAAPSAPAVPEFAPVAAAPTEPDSGAPTPAAGTPEPPPADPGADT